MRKILSGIKKILKILIGFPVYYLSKIFPKKKKLSIIGSSLGRHFADNSKYYYLYYYSQNRSDLNLVWISKNRDVVKDIKSKGLPAEFLYSLKGIYTTLRASKAYLSHQLTDINGPLMGGAKIIQLWHGMALRKIGFGGDWHENSFSGKININIAKWFPYAYYMKCDILYAPCQIAKENLKESFSKSFKNNKIEENIFLVRQARTLCFDNNFDIEERFFPEIRKLEILSDKYKKIVAWLPTHRTIFKKTILDTITDSKLDLNQLNEFFKSNNSLFVIKAHFLDFDKISKIVKNYDFIYVYQYADPYPLLKFTDILITDYSSVFFDFLLLNRPILFMSHDFNKYSNHVGFYFDYKNLEIGLITDSWIEILNNISNIFKNEDDFYEKRSQKLKQLNFVENYLIKE